MIVIPFSTALTDVERWRAYRQKLLLMRPLLDRQVQSYLQSQLEPGEVFLDLASVRPPPQPLPSLFAFQEQAMREIEELYRNPRRSLRSVDYGSSPSFTAMAAMYRGVLATIPDSPAE